MPDQPRYLSQHDPFAQALMAALRLPTRTLSFELHFGVNEAPTCRVLFHPDTPAGLDPTPMLREYRLERIGAGADLAVSVPPAGPDEAADEDIDAGMVGAVDPERSTILEAVEIARRRAVADVERHVRESDERSGGALLGVGRQPAEGLPDEAAGQRVETWALMALGALALLVVLSFVLGWWG